MKYINEEGEPYKGIFEVPEKVTYKRLGNQNGISEEAASAGAGADVSSSFGFALPLTEKSATTMETFS